MAQGIKNGPVIMAAGAKSSHPSSHQSAQPLWLPGWSAAERSGGRPLGHQAERRQLSTSLYA